MKIRMNNFPVLIKKHYIKKGGKFRGIVYNSQIFMSPLLKRSKSLKPQIFRYKEMPLLGDRTI